MSGFFFLRNSNTAGQCDFAFQFGTAGQDYIPLAGDWDGDGIETIGLYDPVTGTFFLRNSNSSGPPDVTFTFGPISPGNIQPIHGDWDGEFTTTVGVMTR